MPYRRDLMHATSIAGLLVALALTVGCSSPTEHPDADAGGESDGGTFERPQGMSSTLWLSVQAMSPQGGVSVPADPTNQWADDEAAVRLGQYLFFEEKLSGNGEVACATCHQPDNGWGDGLPLATDGVGGTANPTGRHTPTLLNAAFSTWYFWDGRADTLWGQASGPIEHPVEMAGTRIAVVRYVYDNVEVRKAYESIFGELPPRASLDPFPLRGRPVPDPQTPTDQEHQAAWASMTDDDQDTVNRIFSNVLKAIAAYERRLVSMNAPFDRYVDQLREFPNDPQQWTAIDATAQEGARLFVEVVGCAECHDGPMLTDGAFHNLGLPQREWADPNDQGRWTGLPQARESLWSSAGAFSDDPECNQAQLLMALPQREADKGAFRTPSLRNLSSTAPFMHAGQLATLREVLEFYNEPPDGVPLVGRRSSEVNNLKLDSSQIDALLAFLESLNGEPVPAEYRERPDSPL